MRRSAEESPDRREEKRKDCRQKAAHEACFISHPQLDVSRVPTAPAVVGLSPFPRAISYSSPSPRIMASVSMPVAATAAAVDGRCALALCMLAGTGASPIIA